jgi:hypothetical protein
MAGQSEIVINADVDALPYRRALWKFHLDLGKLWRVDIAFLLEKSGGPNGIQLLLIVTSY